MKYQFEENAHSYYLVLNGKTLKRYSKKIFSKQEAESKASEIVERAIKKFGSKVEYDGVVSV